jgi:hypothetical protein
VLLPPSLQGCPQEAYLLHLVTPRLQRVGKGALASSGWRSVLPRGVGVPIAVWPGGLHISRSRHRARWQTSPSRQSSVSLSWLQRKVIQRTGPVIRPNDKDSGCIDILQPGAPASNGLTPPLLLAFTIFRRNRQRRTYRRRRKPMNEIRTAAQPFETRSSSGHTHQTFGHVSPEAWP